MPTVVDQVFSQIDTNQVPVRCVDWFGADWFAHWYGVLNAVVLCECCSAVLNVPGAECCGTFTGFWVLFADYRVLSAG